MHQSNNDCEFFVENLWLCHLVVFSCPEGLFKCQSQEACLEQSAVCDGSSDCEDDSDEMNCSSRSPLTVSTPRTIHPTQLQATDEPPSKFSLLSV